MFQTPKSLEVERYCRQSLRSLQHFDKYDMVNLSLFCLLQKVYLFYLTYDQLVFMFKTFFFLIAQILEKIIFNLLFVFNVKWKSPFILEFALCLIPGFQQLFIHQNICWGIDGICSMHELIAIPIVTVQLKNYLMNRQAFTSSKSTMETPICSKLTVKTPERGHCGRSYVFIVNFEQISHMILLFWLLTLSK